MSNLFLGQIVMFAGNFAPKNTAFCDGQLLPISLNTALFSLLGTYYGGDGRATFALPNLQGSVPVGQGQGPGLSLYDIGESGGSQSITLLTTEMPAHTHTFSATTANATGTSPSGLVPAVPTVANASAYAVSQSSPYPALVPAAMNPESCSVGGGSQPHNNMMPTLFITFLIVLVGVYPARN